MKTSNPKRDELGTIKRDESANRMVSSGSGESLYACAVLSLGSDDENFCSKKPSAAYLLPENRGVLLGALRLIGVYLLSVLEG